MQPNPTEVTQVLTDLCVWWMANRDRARAWAATEPTVQGVTYRPQWVDSAQFWVNGWREELKRERPRVRLFGCYLREIAMLKRILGESNG